MKGTGPGPFPRGRNGSGDSRHPVLWEAAGGPRVSSRDITATTTTHTTSRAKTIRPCSICDLIRI